MKKRIRELIPFVAIVVIMYSILYFLKLPCPIKLFTGVSCGGCGITRAWISVLSLNISDAFYYHPLFWTVPIAGLVFLFQDRIPNRVYKMLVYLLAIAFLTVYIYRLIWSETDVVTCNIKDGLIFKLFNKVI